MVFNLLVSVHHYNLNRPAFIPSRDLFVTHHSSNNNVVLSLNPLRPAPKARPLSGPVFSAKLFSELFQLQVQLKLYWKIHIVHTWNFLHSSSWEWIGPSLGATDHAVDFTTNQVYNELWTTTNQSKYIQNWSTLDVYGHGKLFTSFGYNEPLFNLLEGLLYAKFGAGINTTFRDQISGIQQRVDMAVRNGSVNTPARAMSTPVMAILHPRGLMMHRCPYWPYGPVVCTPLRACGATPGRRAAPGSRATCS